MGGPFSGRWRWDKMLLVEQCLQIDMIRLKWEGLLLQQYTRGTFSWGRPGPDQPSIRYEMLAVPVGGRALRLRYHLDQRAVDQLIWLTPTAMFFGGVRWWFRCPTCGHRVRKLYLPPGGQGFFCRACHVLAYASCQRAHKRVAFYRRNPAVLRAALQSGKPDLAAIRAAFHRPLTKG